MVCQRNEFVESGPRILCSVEGLVGYIGRNRMGLDTVQSLSQSARTVR